MNQKRPTFSASLRSLLENLSLVIKFSILFISGTALFPFFIGEGELQSYFWFLVAFVLLLSSCCILVIGPKAFRAVLVLWLIGTAIYFLFAVPRIYSGEPLSPSINPQDEIGRWIYSIATPLRLLGTFAIGLTIASVISPTEFLKWRRVGPWIALLFRSVQFSIQSFQDTRLALLMQNQWPDKGNGLIRPRESWLTVRYGPTLVFTTIRNVLLWYPWAWVSFNKLQYKLERNLR